AQLAASGVAVAYITHRLDEVFRLGQRLTVLRDGRVVATRAIADVTTGELVRLMANRDVNEHYPKVRREPGKELLRAEGLGRHGAVANIRLALDAGQVTGIGGLIVSRRR